MTTLQSRLLSMLRYRRPAGSDSERAFINRFIRPVPGMTKDQFGNWSVVIGERPSILFSAHTDSVHRTTGMQKIHVDAHGLVTLDDARKRSVYTFKGKTWTTFRTRGGCLGADDAAGCFLLLELIAAGIEGRYIFHRAEERGGIGSAAIVGSQPAWLADISHAIAFDRRHTTDIITHQAAGRTASTAFAVDFAARLNAADPTFDYSPCEGIFTDTANYADDVPECTNVSVGYDREHSDDESLDTRHVMKLRKALLTIDWSDLVVNRAPAEWNDAPTAKTLSLREVFEAEDDLDALDTVDEWRDSYSFGRSAVRRSGHPYLSEDYRAVHDALVADGLLSDDDDDDERGNR